MNDFVAARESDALRSSADEAWAGKPRLRIVHYLRRVRLEDGGVVRAVLDICVGLTAGGHDVTLLTEEATDVPAHWCSNLTGVPRVVVSRLPRLLGSLPAVVENALAGADVLHLHGAWDAVNLRLARLARSLDIPYVVTPHGMLDDWQLRQKRLKKMLFLALFGRRFWTGAACVHCTAVAELTQAARLLRPGSGVVVPLPIDLAAYAELPGLELALAKFPLLNAAVPRVLFLSRLHPKKRPDVLISGAAKLKELDVSCNLILAGPGEANYVAQLKRQARLQGLENRVLFPGMVRGPLKVSLYQAADVFVLPTSQENFGYVLLEAMAAGTPVVTTRGVDIWEELQAAGALVVEPTPGALAAAVRDLLGDRKAARQRGQQGRAWVFSAFSPDRIMEKYGQMYYKMRGLGARPR